MSTDQTSINKLGTNPADWVIDTNQYPLFDTTEKIVIKTDGNESALSSQVGGDHYKKLGEFQPWNVLSKWLTPEELFGYMKGTVIAYLARNKENPREDAEKAMHTIQLYLELSEKK